MRIKSIFFLSSLSLGLLGCNSDDDNVEIDQPYVIDFNNSSNNFTAIFSDYPVSTSEQNNEEFYQLKGAYGTMPEPFLNDNAWFLQGNNHSDDLLMAIKGQIEGLERNTLYAISISVELTTSVPSNCFGIGGAPGESVYVKLAASTDEPVNEIVSEMYRLENFDIGNQSSSGTQGQSVGDIANGLDCMEQEQLIQKELTTMSPIDVTTDDEGKFWVLAGSDSGFEGLSYYYINKITLNISE